MSNGTKVKKRDGRVEPLDLDKMHLMVEEACNGLAGVSASQVEIQSGIQFYDGITTGEIQEILIKSASDLIDLDHVNYQFVAARLLLFAVRKRLYGKIRDLPNLEQHIYNCTNIDVYDKDIFTYRFWQYLGTETSNTWWQTEEIGSSNYLDNIYDRLEIEPNAIYLSPETYFDSDGESYYFKVIRVQERLPVEERQGGFFISEEPTFFGTENARKIKLWWKDDDDTWQSYIIRIDSVFDDSTDISTYQEKIEAFNSTTPNTIEYEIRDNSYPYTTRDQIKLDGSKLVVDGGETNAETNSVKVTIRAYFKYSNGYTFENEEDSYEDLTVTIKLSDDEFTRTQSSKIIESTANSTSISIVEDNAGDILLDLKDFNIDPGSAKINDVKINYKTSKSNFEAYLGEIFYIDENFLKFSEGALYDYDGDQILFIHHIRNDDNDSNNDVFTYTTIKGDVTSDVRNNDFEITFTYKSNGKDFEHTLKIIEYEDSDSGSFITQDHVLTDETYITDNKYINGPN